MIALSMLLTLALSATPGADAPQATSVVIRHVTVIDATGAKAKGDQAVVIGEGKIVAVGDDGSIATPTGAKVADGSGKFLIPGLWDMHVHFAQEGGMRLFLANGV